MKTKMPLTISWNGKVWELEIAFKKKYPDSLEHQYYVRYVLKEDLFQTVNQRAIIDSEWEGTSLKNIEKEVLNWIKWQNATDITE